MPFTICMFPPHALCVLCLLLPRKTLHVQPYEQTFQEKLNVDLPRLCPSSIPFHPCQHPHTCCSCHCLSGYRGHPIRAYLRDLPLEYTPRGDVVYVMHDVLNMLCDMYACAQVKAKSNVHAHMVLFSAWPMIILNCECTCVYIFTRNTLIQGGGGESVVICIVSQIPPIYNFIPLFFSFLF